MIGKILGILFGLMFGGVFGAVLGFFLGHSFDKARHRLRFAGVGGHAVQQQFLNTSFAVMGHIAKSKGVVTQHEIQIASLLMDQMRLQGEARQQAQDAFRQGKESDYPLEEELEKFVQQVQGRLDLRQMFMEIQLQGVFADGVVDASERKLLTKVAKALGFSDAELNMMIRRWEAEVNFHRRQRQGGGGGPQAEPSRDQLADAYKILGVTTNETDQQVKRAYRKLMTQHHPDKLVAKGLPPEMMEQAKQHAQNIQQAYEVVKKQRGMR